MARITGRVEIRAAGELLLSKPGATASGIGLGAGGNFELTEVMGDSGIHGFVESPVVAKLEVTITDTNDLLLSKLAAVREDPDSTVIFETAGSTGKVYTMADPTCTRNFSLTSGEGETTLTFVGKNWVESLKSA